MNKPDFLQPDQSLDHLSADTKFLGRAELLQAFIDSTAHLTARVSELGFLAQEPGAADATTFIDKLDESVHEQEPVDQTLSKQIGKILTMAESKVITEDIPRIVMIFNESGSFLLGIDQDQPLEEAEVEFDDPLSQVASKYNQKVERERQEQLSRQLTDDEKSYLKYIHLSRAEGAEKLGVAEWALVRKLSTTRSRLGFQTTEQLALYALNSGVSFDVTDPPPANLLNIEERQVATSLNRTNAEIREGLSLSPKQLNRIIRSIYQKTGTNNRTEVLLMAHIYGFEPDTEELIDKTPEQLKNFTELERSVIRRIFLPTPDIVKELNFNNASVATNAIARAADRLGVNGRIALAVSLQESGFAFDVKKPEQPLADLLSQRDFDIAKTLGSKPHKEIAAEQGLDEGQVGVRVHVMKKLTGARTTTELALMVRIFDKGKVKPLYHNIKPREERFFELIGVEPTPMEDARSYLEMLSPRQAEYVEAYYFAEKQLSWRAIGKRFSVRREAAVQTSNRGLAKIRSKLSREVE